MRKPLAPAKQEELLYLAMAALDGGFEPAPAPGAYCVTRHVAELVQEFARDEGEFHLVPVRNADRAAAASLERAHRGHAQCVKLELAQYLMQAIDEQDQALAIAQVTGRRDDRRDHDRHPPRTL